MPTPHGQTIALCMIVRNEERVLDRCLRSVRDLVDTWVICDTGSTDGTREVIRSVLGELPGELHETRWIDFGNNRSELMKRARGAADYLLLIDADMEVVQRAPLPELTADGYFLRETGDLDFAVLRLVRGDRSWWYEGSTHEYIATGGALPPGAARCAADRPLRGRLLASGEAVPGCRPAQARSGGQARRPPLDFLPRPDLPRPRAPRGGDRPLPAACRARWLAGGGVLRKPAGGDPADAARLRVRRPGSARGVGAPADPRGAALRARPRIPRAPPIRARPSLRRPRAGDSLSRRRPVRAPQRVRVGPAARAGAGRQRPAAVRGGACRPAHAAARGAAAARDRAVRRSTAGRPRHGALRDGFHAGSALAAARRTGAEHEDRRGRAGGIAVLALLQPEHHGERATASG